MWYRIAGAVVATALAVALFVGLDAVVDVRFAAAVSVGLGTAVFLVVDGSAGAGEGWIYHRVRARPAKVLDGAICAVAGVGLGLLGAGLSLALDLGELGSLLLVLSGALFGANAAFVFRRPNYEERLEDEEE